MASGAKSARNFSTVRFFRIDAFREPTHKSLTLRDSPRYRYNRRTLSQLIYVNRVRLRSKRASMSAIPAAKCSNRAYFTARDGA